MGSMQENADMIRLADGQFPPLDSVPTHIGIIMDGNGRWAAQQGKPRSAGHRAGVENIRRVLEACVQFGVQILTVYAFSTENWDRPRAEVSTLMGLLAQALRREVPELHKNGVRLCHLGRLDLRVQPPYPDREQSLLQLHPCQRTDRRGAQGVVAHHLPQ